MEEKDIFDLSVSKEESKFVKDSLLAKLDKKDRKRMYEYLMHLLYTAEEERKADIMGKVFCSYKNILSRIRKMIISQTTYILRDYYRLLNQGLKGHPLW